MWIVCQIGAREHYAVPRALHGGGALQTLITDFWVPPGQGWAQLPGCRRLRDRYHEDLDDARVFAPNLGMLGFEMSQRLLKRGGWPLMMERNRVFQKKALMHLRRVESQASRTEVPTLFSYSYSALELLRYAKQQGWNTVLGQIDPGPHEEQIVAEEHRRYPKLASSWQPVPAEYWQQWREELKLADRVIVNSEWSRDCLLKEGVSAEKLEVVPLVYQAKSAGLRAGNMEQGSGASGQEAVEGIQNSEFKIQNSHTTRVLFLGQVILRKGIGRLLDAMRMLKDEPIKLTLAGPSEIDPSAWADLPNVQWVGPVPRSEVGALYGQADVFILPTLSDGYAITQLEALSRGLPVIASRHCGNAVEAGRNGWILRDLEPETIRDLLMEVRHSRHALKEVTAPRFGLQDLAGVLLANEPSHSGGL
jgi:glycosyltransferase involved in cell wall biosynthesis